MGHKYQVNIRGVPKNALSEFLVNPLLSEQLVNPWSPGQELTQGGLLMAILKVRFFGTPCMHYLGL